MMEKQLCGPGGDSARPEHVQPYYENSSSASMCLAY